MCFDVLWTYMAFYGFLGNPHLNTPPEGMSSMAASRQQPGGCDRPTVSGGQVSVSLVADSESECRSGIFWALDAFWWSWWSWWPWCSARHSFKLCRIEVGLPVASVINFSPDELVTCHEADDWNRDPHGDLVAGVSHPNNWIMNPIYLIQFNIFSY